MNIYGAQNRNGIKSMEQSFEEIKKLGICEIAFSGLQKNIFSHNEVNNVGNLCMFGSIFFFPFLD